MQLAESQADTQSEADAVFGGGAKPQKKESPKQPLGDFIMEEGEEEEEEEEEEEADNDV